MIDPVLWNLLPIIRRARGDRLYGNNERHWVDFWKQDGAWLLGRRPDQAAKEWKNQLDKGLGGLFPSLWPQRAEPLVRALVPGSDAVRLWDRGGDVLSLPSWRPWTEAAEAEIREPCRVRLPSGPSCLAAVAYPKAWSQALPPHAVSAPTDAAAIVKAAALLLRAHRNPAQTAVRERSRQEFDRRIAPLGVFVRDGQWFRFAGDAPLYKGLFSALLESGFILAPHPQSLSVLPFELSDGEWKSWAKALKAWKESVEWNS